ncbi:MAG: SGNH/GDSL hydrolase family protein [Ruminococcus sp.]|nr:SGNH/GDSL hydrolase family protein [Ruminococcus sp.]MCD7801001.1 SGNH/GDSL hydrolase family protein [Ruminococcus sp.]
MKKFSIFLMACIFAVFSSACSSEIVNLEDTTTSTQTVEDTTITTLETEVTTETSTEKEYLLSDSTDPKFDEYVSNTLVATGNNYVVEKADEVTYRAYFPVEEYGELEYCFYFSNTVDSTYKYGELAYVGRVGEGYTITSAYIADGGTSIEDEITNRTAVTFDDGNISKEVGAGETYWSDSITFDVPQDHYLVWEWTVSGENIACTYMSSLTSTTADSGDGDFKYCDQIPLPQLIGAKRDTKLNIVAIGDSITQGCQTEFMKYEFWSARISQMLGEDYAFWNCGLGWSRTSDASQCGDWLSRASTGDIVIVAFGTNDINTGEYMGDGGNSAQEIVDYLKVILDELTHKGCEVILFNAPPEDYGEEKESVRLEYNQMVEELSNEYGIYFFDFASYLSDEENPAKALYGGHPNGEGGQIVADAFLEQFKDLLQVE